jgi:hypothetical protein
MSRLSWRQRLIAVAIGVAAAALQAHAPALKAAHAAVAPACSVQSANNC